MKGIRICTFNLTAFYVCTGVTHMVEFMGQLDIKKRELFPNVVLMVDAPPVDTWSIYCVEKIT